MNKVFLFELVGFGRRTKRKTRKRKGYKSGSRAKTLIPTDANLNLQTPAFEEMNCAGSGRIYLDQVMKQN